MWNETGVIITAKVGLIFVGWGVEGGGGAEAIVRLIYIYIYTSIIWESILKKNIHKNTKLFIHTEDTYIYNLSYTSPTPSKLVYIQMPNLEKGMTLAQCIKLLYSFLKCAPIV